jgi:cytochrome c1
MIEVITKELEKLSHKQLLRVLYLIRNLDLLNKVNTACHGQPSSRFNTIIESLIFEHKQEQEAVAHE